MFKILLPTDFSDNAWNAISYAMEFFKNEVCTFYLLHTYTPAFYRMDYIMGGPSFSAIPDIGVDISQAGLDKTLEQLRTTYNNPKHKVKTISAFNLLTDEINEVSIEKDIDLIIMGTQGATGAKEIFLGTNTVFVLRKALVPILVIPEEYRFKPVRTILFPTDYRTQYKEEEIATIMGFAAIQESEITVLHIKEPFELSQAQQENKDHLKQCLAQVSHRFEEKEVGPMPDAVIDYIDKHNYDLLTMMNRKHSFMERLLWRQNVDQIGFHTQVPFLVIRDTGKIVK